MFPSQAWGVLLSIPAEHVSDPQDLTPSAPEIGTEATLIEARVAVAADRGWLLKTAWGASA